MADNEMVGWHHQFKGHDLGQTPGKAKYREAWSAAAHGVTKNRTRLSD